MGFGARGLRLVAAEREQTALSADSAFSGGSGLFSLGTAVGPAEAGRKLKLALRRSVVLRFRRAAGSGNILAEFDLEDYGVVAGLLGRRFDSQAG